MDRGGGHDVRFRIGSRQRFSNMCHHVTIIAIKSIINIVNNYLLGMVIINFDQTEGGVSQ